MWFSTHNPVIRIFVFAACLWFGGCEYQSLQNGTSQVAYKLASKIERGSRVAIAGFYDEDTKDLSQIDETLYSNLYTDLVDAASDTFTVIPMKDLKAALKMLNMQRRELFDEHEAAEVGKFLGANMMICGSTKASRYWGSYTLNSRAFYLEYLNDPIVARTYFRDSDSILPGLFLFLSVASLVVFFIYLYRILQEKRIRKTIAQLE